MSNSLKSTLTDKVCVPCQGDIPALTDPEIESLLGQLGNQWSLNAAGHLFKRYSFANFMKAMDFANKLAIIAEKEGHHPNLSIGWGYCTVEIWTHKIQGLTESDFILAAKFEAAQ